MPKIRDLAINTIPSDGPADAGRDAGGYWMCQKSGVPPPASTQCQQKPEKPKKNTGSLPHDAVVQLRQQLQQQTRNQLHG